MRLVKVKRDGKSAQGVLAGNDVWLVDGWRWGLADAAPLMLGGKGMDKLRTLLGASTDTVPVANVTPTVSVDSLARIFRAEFNCRPRLTEISSDLPQFQVIQANARYADGARAADHSTQQVRNAETRSEDRDRDRPRGTLYLGSGSGSGSGSGRDGIRRRIQLLCWSAGIREYRKRNVTSREKLWRTGATGP